MSNLSWQATASLQALKQRAQMLKDIRSFFEARDVLEVDTPVLMRGATTDVYLDSISADVNVAGTKERLYLQTSPEFALKRLLASHGQSVFQIAKAFRNGEAGSRHNPEFTMLEWYRPGMSFQALMDEVAELVGAILSLQDIEFFSYRNLFKAHVGLDPFSALDSELQAACIEKTNCDMTGEPREACLDLLMSHCVEPMLGRQCLTFVYDFPEGQAALAKKHLVEDMVVARRFELYVEGSEIANGYDELLDGEEQKARFEADNQARESIEKPLMPWDRKLVSALNSGMPACCGVALGIERLLMVCHGYSSIEDVIAFPHRVI